jgi:hypothetical protein
MSRELRNLRPLEPLLPYARNGSKVHPFLSDLPARWYREYNGCSDRNREKRAGTRRDTSAEMSWHQ